MKNTLKNLCFAVFALCSMMFAACGKSSADAYNCYNNYDDAAKNAKKQNQDILVLLTMDGDDEYSTEFLDSTVRAEGFVQQVSSKYSVLLIDFGQSSYEKTVEKDDATEAEKKEAKAFADIMEKNSELATKLNAQYAPSIYLLTKEGYFISQVELLDKIENLQAFTDLLASYREQEDSVNKMVADISAAKGMDKVTAIDTLYESTNGLYRSMLSDYVGQVIELDKKNESGLLSKYLLAQAENKALELYLNNDSLSAVKEYVKICENQYLTPEHKQQAYYMAAYILNSSGSDDLDTVMMYLQKALEVYPDGPNNDAIKNVMEYITTQKEAVSSEQE